MNEIVDVVEDSFVPLNVIDQLVPEGSPDSVNITSYFVVCVFTVVGIFVEVKFIFRFTVVFCS